MEKSCEVYNGQERRTHCELVVELKAQMVNQSMQFDSLLKKVDDISKFVSKLETPYNVGIWAGSIILGSIILSILGFVGFLVRSKFVK